MMSGLQMPPAYAGQSDDALYQQILLAGIQSCRGWAHTRLTGGLGMLLWPKDRGPLQDPERAYQVTQRTIELGIWRVTLCQAGCLPAGVQPGTRDAVVRTQIARACQPMTATAVNEVIQCGLFGEVLYR